MKLLLAFFSVFLLMVSALSVAAEVSNTRLSVVNEISSNEVPISESSISIREIKKLIVESCKEHPDCPYTSVRDFNNRIGLTISYDPSRALTIPELKSLTVEMLKNRENLYP